MTTPREQQSERPAVRTVHVAMLTVAALLAACLPAAAQNEPSLAIRPFVFMSEQAFTANETFSAGFGGSIQPFYGGGLSFVSGDGYFLDLTASRFKKTGERAFFFDGQRFPLNIPMAVTVTPLELVLGYRFAHSRRVVPYVGGGVGSYRYQETSNDAADDEPLDVRQTGYLAVAGVEVRTARWLRVGVDAQYSRVTGILGEGGLSQLADEGDLGGLAGRVRLTVGR
jgi:opacity protein-like surface antigen